MSTNSNSTTLSLKELIKEKETLLNLLDKVSNLIRTCENQLVELKFHFPFKVCIKEEDSIKVYISWELVKEDSKNYRLFLLIESEVEQILRKPFIETNLEIRLKYSSYLGKFIDRYTDYLKEINEKFIGIL